MDWRVTYDAEASAGLLEIYRLGPDRPRVAAALARLERRLRADPHAGRSAVREGLCLTEEPPLRAAYDVRPDDRTVVFRGFSLLPGSGWSRGNVRGPRPRGG